MRKARMLFPFVERWLPPSPRPAGGRSRLRAAATNINRSCCRRAGSSSAPLPGSAATAVSPSTSSATAGSPLPSSSRPRSVSCCVALPRNLHHEAKLTGWAPRGMIVDAIATTDRSDLVCMRSGPLAVAFALGTPIGCRIVTGLSGYLANVGLNHDPAPSQRLHT